MKKREFDEIKLALAHFGIDTSMDKVTIDEVEAKYDSINGSYSTEDSNEENRALTTRHFSILTNYINKREYIAVLNSFGNNYNNEIKNNMLSDDYVKNMSDAGKTKFSTEEIAERLLDKKFAFHFLNELGVCGYNKVVRYGQSTPKNTNPPMSPRHSRLAAVLLYSDDNSLPPLVVELGNRAGGIKIGAVTVSARDGGKKAENCAVFKLLVNPSREKMVFAGNSHSTALLPNTLKNKHFKISTDIRDKVEASMNTALSRAIASMPKEMQEFAKARGHVMKENSEQNSYAVPHEDEDRSTPSWVTDSTTQARETKKQGEPESPKSNTHH